MFHTYVKAKSGRQIDIDRALWVADKGLFDQCHAKMVRGYTGGTFSEWNTAMVKRAFEAQGGMVQAIWDVYCYQHKLKYGEPFEPDVSLTWDA